MAKNLQAKLSAKDSIGLFDINRETAQKLAAEMTSTQSGGASVTLASSIADASRDAVCLFYYSTTSQLPLPIST